MDVVLQGRAYFAPDDVALTVQGIEAALETNLPALADFAELHGWSDFEEVRAHGSHAVYRNQGLPKRRRGIPVKWQLAKAARKCWTGSIDVRWASDYQDGTGYWHASVGWNTRDPRSPNGNLVYLSLSITGPARQLAERPRARSQIAATLVDTLAVAPALCSWSSVSNFAGDDPRSWLNQYSMFDGVRGAFGYSWMVWVPPSVADLVGEPPSSPALDVIAVADPPSGGRLVVAHTPPVYMTTEELTSYRNFLLPSLLPENLDSPVRRRTDLERPPGILAEDWQTARPEAQERQG